MPIFEAVDAAEGDTILLRFEDSAGRPRMWLIDGGPKASNRTGKRFYPLTDALLPRLAELRMDAGSQRTTLDLVVCTHIDDDHINGIERLMRCKAEPGLCAVGENKRVRTAPVEINEVWFNSFSALLGATTLTKRPLNDAPPNAAIVVSVKQGDDLTRHLTQLGLSGNPRFNDLTSKSEGLIVGPARIKVHGIDVTVLAPGPGELDELREEWVKESRVFSVTPQDFAPENRLDDSVANLSSIALLAEFPASNGRPGRVLLTGDARGDHIVRGYRAAGERDPLPIDVMKVPHHGAYANMHSSLLKLFPADHYVFSANSKHDNPDPPVVETVARVCAQTRPITLHFTNEITWSKPHHMDDGTRVRSLREMKAALDADPNLGPNLKWNFREAGRPSIIIPF